MNRSIILGATIISIAILANGFLERRASSAATLPAAPAPALPADVIAVIPFASAPGADAQVAEAIQHEIVTRLATKHVKAAAVHDAPASGEMLVGTMQHAGNQIRLNVQLVDAASHVPRWAETYQRDITDVFALESELAKAVADVVAANKT